MKPKTMGLIIWTAAVMGLAGTAGADSSAIATVLDMSFEGELTTTSSWDLQSQIKGQLLYTIGSLNASNSVGRFDKVVLTNVQRTSLGGGRSKVTYHAKMPVAWGSKTNLPASFTFTLPRDVSYAGLEAFATRYKNSCVDFGAHDVNPGNMWFYYRPRAAGCSLAAADVARFTASAVVSPANTTGKFPEYDKVWEDGELRVIVIFAKYEDGATTSVDAGISAYNEFVRTSKTRLLSSGSGYETVPASVPSSPGASMPIVEQRVRLADGKRVTVSAFLVDDPSSAGAAFDSRYEELSGRADLIVYNGRAGFGANVRALARKGSWIADQYVIGFMNASDTYAYIDSTLFDRHAAVNSGDPTGTKHTDVIVNAMPAYFSSQSKATMAFINGLLSYSAPRTYEQIFREVDPSQVVMVTGEADNTFVPAAGGETALPIRVQSSVTKNEQKRLITQVADGTYVVTLAHDPAAPGGDADLYVRIGAEPTTTAYDCRPYKSGSDETCEVTLAAPAQLFTVVRGYASQSSAYILTIAAEGGGG